MFLCLGGGNEVGRSCHIIQYKGKTVMVLFPPLLCYQCFQCLLEPSFKLDAGIHPAYEGLAALPYYDEFDLSTVDVLLISQYVAIFVSLTNFTNEMELADKPFNFAYTSMGCEWSSECCAERWSLFVICSDGGLLQVQSRKCCQRIYLRLLQFPSLVQQIFNSITITSTVQRTALSVIQDATCICSQALDF